MFALSYGAVLLGLSTLAARLRPEEHTLDGAYLAQGLALITLGFISKLTGPQLAIVLAVQSAALLTASRWRHGLLYQIAAALCGLGACGVALVQLDLAIVPPLALGAPVAALLFIDAWWSKRQRDELERFSAASFGFAVLGLGHHRGGDLSHCPYAVGARGICDRCVHRSARLPRPVA
jgi:hypothetical protein